ncbi:flagellar hook-basal body complex protein [Haloimpatiens lingqiaonensis]|uniref:flagellar hook-basal body complex protein n=1 Tax=Haloimpatiens lingqiaonensis TaxID=1380675 RepID=UPI0010FE83C5|nr:flagellar hook-basal body complex protein [Haloimpatiens lingqiaonensis]
MIRGLYTAVSGLITEEAKQQSITNNLANANNNGYKKEDLRFKDFREAAMINYDKVINGKNTKQKLGNLSLGSKIDDVVVKFTQGAIVETNNKTDFAIDGEGFFTVQDEKGRTLYTRDGSFRVDIQGNLVNSSGYKVLGFNSNGKLEAIKVGNDKIICDSVGNIKLNDREAYKFAFAGFNEGDIKKIGDNLFSSDKNPTYINTHVKQECIEKSNVNIINEMIDMMTVMRNFESNQKIVQTMDDTLGKLISGVGEVR